MQKSVTSLTDIPEIANYLNRVNAEPRSLRLAVVREKHGAYWRDIARIYFDPLSGSVKVYGSDDQNFAPTKDEEKAIKDALPNYRFPQSKRVMHYEVPSHLKEREAADCLFHFKDRDGQLIMLVARYDKKGSEDKKVYVAWTLFDDDEWRCAEPDGKLPLYNLENLKPEHTTVFLHEGPKKARHVHRLINPHTDEERAAFDAHPWIDDLSLPDVCHLGWHGGALNPYRTDWSALKRAGIKRVFIVSDNDAPGTQAVPKIAAELSEMKVHNVRFNKRFPPSWDMAEPFPKSFFEHDGDIERYIGPTFENLLSPATWATEVVGTGKKGKVFARLRPEFQSQWMWCRDQDVYVNLDRPSMCYDAPTFNKMIAPFSDTKAVADLLNSEYTCQGSRLTYRPDIDARVVDEEDAPAAVNTFTPSRIRSLPGNSQPWEDFLEHLFPDAEERHEVMKWCATLIAKPEVRMTYSLLLVSERQGVGKTTLGEQVLAPLVGWHNASCPSERTIVDSQFNSWIAEKRLVIVGEIYSGKSWKAYQNLKSYVADKNVEVNKKYLASYTLLNWAHFICSSNSLRALKIEDTDRRWYIPEVTEQAWGEDNFRKFRRWLRSGGGLRIIKHWAEQFGDYVEEGFHSPDTARKREMVEESKPGAVKLLDAWCEAHTDDEIIVADRDIKAWIIAEKENSDHLTALELRRVMARRGWVNPGLQVLHKSVLQYVMMSPLTAKKWTGFVNGGVTDKEKRKWIDPLIKPLAQHI